MMRMVTIAITLKTKITIAKTDMITIATKTILTIAKATMRGIQELMERLHTGQL